jgi:Tol biopolymer transport system component
MNSDGSGKMRLTSGPGTDGCAASPVWSPDGSRIAFVRNYDDPSGSDREFPGEIYVIRGDGTGLRRLTGRIIDVSQPEWSPDGRALAFESRQLPARIKIVSLDGTSPRAVGPRLEWPAEPAWSPDGREIAVVQRVRSDITKPARSSIGAFSPSGTVVRSLVTARRGELGSPLWSPDGSTLAFMAYRCANAGTCRGDVRLTSTRSGAADRRLILLPGSGVDSLAWSPDGRTIAGANGLPGIWTMRLGQARPARLTRNDADVQPVWSSDGRAIAFARLDFNVGGTKDAIFVIASDGRGLRRLALGHQPSWQPLR